MKERKIAFIICVNHDKYMAECRYYIERLYLPKDYKIQIIEMRNAKSMTSGYNAAMKQTDARYKIYLHQDVFMLNRNFIEDILECFRKDEAIGAIGMLGTTRLQNANVWNSLDIGGSYFVGTYTSCGSIAVRPEILNPGGSFQEVDYIDGMLMATACDVEWDERVDGFHFYDVSQCIRIRERGKKTVIVRQDVPWLFHDMGPMNLLTYRENQKRFCELYHLESGDMQDSPQIYQMCDTIAMKMRPWFDSGEYARIEGVLKEIGNAIYFNQELLTMYFVMEIHTLETRRGEELILGKPFVRNAFQEIENRWHTLRWTLIRVAFGHDSVERIASLIEEGMYSIPAVIVAALHNIPAENMGIVYDVGGRLEEKDFLRVREWEAEVSRVQEYERRNMPSTVGL